MPSKEIGGEEMGASHSTTPLSILKEAIKAVPAVRYALGVAGVAASVAIVAGFKIDYRVAVFGTLIMFGLMFVLVLFSRFSQHAAKELRFLSLTLAWFFVILTISTSTFIFTGFFFNWPQPLGMYVGENSNDSPPNPNVGLTPTPMNQNTPVDSSNRSVDKNSNTQQKPDMAGSPKPSTSPTPESPQSQVSRLIDRCRALYRQTKYDEAIDVCNKALEINPQSSEAFNLKELIIKTKRDLRSTH